MNRVSGALSSIFFQNEDVHSCSSNKIDDKDVTTTSSIPFVTLPKGVLGKIVSYLCIHDILNIRLTCITLHEVSFLKEVLCSLQVSVQSICNRSIWTLVNFLERVQCGRFVQVNILCKDLTYENAELILKCLKNVSVLTFDLSFTNLISVHCPNVKKLIWMNFWQNVQYEKNDELIEQCYYLPKLNMLKELKIQGDLAYVDYPRLPVSLINHIALNLPTLLSLSFSHVYLVRDVSVMFDELKIDYAPHIKEWSFRYVYIHGNFSIKLPSSITSLECLVAEDIHWDYKDCQLKSLLTDGMSLPHKWNIKDFALMEHLVLTRVKFSSIYPPICKHLKSLTLHDCAHALLYLQVLKPFSDSLKHLTLDARSDGYGQFENFRNSDILAILNEIMPRLEILEIRNFQLITPALLEDINSPHLQRIIFRNCNYFPIQFAKSKDSTTFNVVIEDKCYCEVRNY